MPYMNNNGADQPAHLHRLFHTIIVCFITLTFQAKCKAVAILFTLQAGLCLNWLQMLKIGFS